MKNVRHKKKTVSNKPKMPPLSGVQEEIKRPIAGITITIKT